MIYLCKVLTPEFKAKLDTQIESEVKRSLMKKNIPLDRQTYAAEFERIRVRDDFHFMWNHPEEFEETPVVREYYEPRGLWTPEYTTVKLEQRDSGCQVQARVEWNGKIVKIDAIDEIFSFERQEEAAVKV